MQNQKNIIKNMEIFVKRAVPDKSFGFVFKKYEYIGPRENGDLPISHPVNVAKKVANFFPNDEKRRKKLIAVALLHDTLEDTDTTYDELKTNYGKDIADCVLELTNPAHLSDTHHKGEFILEKMRTMSDDALIVKLADRLDNIETLSARKKQKIVSTVRDTWVMLDGITDGQRKLTPEQENLIAHITISLMQYNDLFYKFALESSGKNEENTKK